VKVSLHLPLLLKPFFHTLVFGLVFGFEFTFQIIDKFCYPAIVLIVFLAVGDEDLPAGRQVS
jgi:hypothetical protein